MRDGLILLHNTVYDFVRWTEIYLHFTCGLVYYECIRWLWISYKMILYFVFPSYKDVISDSRKYISVSFNKFCWVKLRWAEASWLSHSFSCLYRNILLSVDFASQICNFWIADFTVDTMLFIIPYFNYLFNYLFGLVQFNQSKWGHWQYIITDWTKTLGPVTLFIWFTKNIKLMQENPRKTEWLLSLVESQKGCLLCKES